MTLPAERMASWRRVNPEKLVPCQLAEHQIGEALDVLDDAASWLAERGVEQWPASFRDPLPTDIPRDRVEELRRYARIGQLWVLRDRGFTDQAVGTIVITHWPDLDFAHHWPGGHTDLFDARYLARMAVRRSVAGQNIGRMLIGYAAWVASNIGVSKLRLDCSKTNTKLHDYYRQQGFTHVGTVDMPDRKTGALFERAL